MGWAAVPRFGLRSLGSWAGLWARGRGKVLWWPGSMVVGLGAAEGCWAVGGWLRGWASREVWVRAMSSREQQGGRGGGALICNGQRSTFARQWWHHRASNDGMAKRHPPQLSCIRGELHGETWSVCVVGGLWRSHVGNARGVCGGFPAWAGYPRQNRILSYWARVTQP